MRIFVMFWIYIEYICMEDVYSFFLLLFMRMAMSRIRMPIDLQHRR